MNDSITWVGMDVHKASISIAMLLPEQRKAVEWQVVNESRAVKRMIRRIEKSAPGEVRTCYEAGPTGYALQRQILDRDVVCEVVAPSLIPRKPGERIKTDRRDALKLAELLRADMLTEVRPPTPEEEAVRDLCRAREDCKQDQTRCRQRISKFLLRRGISYTAGKRAWTQMYHKWLRSLRFTEPASRETIDDYLLGLDQVTARLANLVKAIEAKAFAEPYREAVGVLRCFRGIDTISAMTIITELHGFQRFSSPRELMAYIGIVPSEHSSGESKRRGAITKSGNGHVRRIIIEASWHYRHRPAIGAILRKRRVGQPGSAIAVADKAMQRLYKRYWHLLQRGKPSNKAATAVARELSGFLWAVLYPVAIQGEGHAA